MPDDESFKLGLGTFDNTDPEQCATSVRTALDIGYRHIDSAQMYGTEAYVREGLSRASVPREDVWVVTKIHPENLAYEDVLSSAEESRERLGVETIDLLYVHWPIGPYDAPETLAAFDELHDRGIIRNVGVSNFTIDLVEEAMDLLDAPVFANQVEMHPLLRQEHLVEHAQMHDYWLVAYSPIARGLVFDVPTLQSIAEKHGVTEAQVSLAWLLQKERVAAVPKATGEDHIREDYESIDVDLTDDDIARIESIEREERLLNEADSILLSKYGGAPWNA